MSNPEDPGMGGTAMSGDNGSQIRPAMTHAIHIAEVTEPNAWRGYKVVLTTTTIRGTSTDTLTRVLRTFQVQSSTPSVTALTAEKRKAARYARELSTQIGATFVERMAFHITAGMIVTIEPDNEAQIPRYDPRMVENAIKNALRGVGQVLKASNVTVQITTQPLLPGEA